ncbi:GPI inositol-deacylase [Neisseriaceae bacterium TC5R-5]|nr:GPI inositol-deacylase [Neisseriaceae bacterium TC5R-5]
MSRYQPKPIAACPPDRINLSSYALIGGEAGACLPLTHHTDTVRYNLIVPPARVIPVIFLPGIMGSNLRMTDQRQQELGRKDNRAWRPDDTWDTLKRGWLSPAERQLSLDPDTTEVDRYEFTGDNPNEHPGVHPDSRHDNVPDGLPDIGLLKNPPPLPPGSIERDKPVTAAQVARWRGWSEVMFGSYGTLLKTLEQRLNDIVQLQPGGAAELYPAWRPDAKASQIPVTGIDPEQWGGGAGHPPVSDDELYRIHHCWYPVHAIGYNWTQSNAVSAGKVAERIRDIMQCYTDNGRQCDKVIIVTHSMGGLVARALLNPDFAGNIADSILGIVHNVQPATGAAATYKRMRTGNEGGHFFEISKNIVSKVMGNDGPNVTAVLGNIPGGLELLPAAHYTAPWLEVINKEQQTLASWPASPAPPPPARPGMPPPPVADSDPAREIYGADPLQWWRLLNPDWVNPGDKKYGEETAYSMALQRAVKAQKFHKKIRDLYHLHTYASYGDDLKRAAYGRVRWQVQESGNWSSPQGWRLLTENGEGKLKVQTPEGQQLTLKVLPPREAGDETVPSTESGSRIQRATILFRQTNYEHQSSYEQPQVLASTLYAVVKLANLAEGWPEPAAEPDTSEAAP